MDSELACVEDFQMENLNVLDLSLDQNIMDEDSHVVVEQEYSEEDDSDEDYNSILKPAFLVEGEPDFDSGPPEDGLEYLRRVRYFFPLTLFYVPLTNGLTSHYVLIYLFLFSLVSFSERMNLF